MIVAKLDNLVKHKEDSLVVLDNYKHGIMKNEVYYNKESNYMKNVFFLLEGIQSLYWNKDMPRKNWSNTPKWEMDHHMHYFVYSFY